MPNPKLSRFLLSAVSLFFALFIVSHDLWAKIYVDIDSPSFRLIPIAICDFNKKTPFSEDWNNTLPEQVKKDLSLTGLFNVLGKKSFLEDAESAQAVSVNTIRFSDWTAIGAEYLLKGNIVVQDQGILTDAYFLTSFAEN